MKFAARTSLQLAAAFCIGTAAPTEASQQPAKQERALEKVLLPNGSECSESSQCASGCCVWNPFANEVCDDDKWYRDCMEEDYTYVESKSGNDVCAGLQEQEQADNQSLLVMSYNLYLILLASDGVSNIEDRATRIGEWFARSPGNTYDVVLLQEVWLSSDIIRDGMVAAGYCHYIYDDRGTFGSGMGVYSKYPIEEHDFRGYQNACGGADCALDKGVIYARINMNERMINVFGTHNMFSVDNHDVRRRQYAVMRGFIDEQSIDSELVLLAGDFNEDKINTPKLYENMLSDLNAGEIPNSPNSSLYSYDPENNGLIDPESAGAGSTQRALDYIFYDKSADVLPGTDSICQYLQPKDLDGNDLSDHYPASCEIMMDEETTMLMSETSGLGESSQSLRSASMLSIFTCAAGLAGSSLMFL